MEGDGHDGCGQPKDSRKREFEETGTHTPRRNEAESSSDHSAPKSRKPARPTLHLDGETLTPEQLVDAAQFKYRLAIKDDAWDRIKASRLMVDAIVQRGEVAYGINTGFGNFASVVIPPEQLQTLQENLIRSHSAGVGSPLSIERARMLLVLRVNVLCKGHSGIRPETVRQLIDAFNKGIVSYVPEKGTVGASGDLAPLAHLALGLLGEGRLWDPAQNQWCPAQDVLSRHGLAPIQLGAKEGLALINGTQFITALGVEAVVRAERACKQADVIAALTLEVLRGSVKPFNAEVHRARPHPGQKLAASVLRALMHDEEHDDQDYYSEIGNSHVGCTKVQDSYTLRCLPQVHGISHDTIEFVKKILTTEMNSATDNPMIFASTGKIISGGNFHGEYPAKALDYLAIGIHEIASISERRIERLCNPALSELPAFLVDKGGLNSGFMIAHCTAAALVSENKVLCHPSSVDSLSTSAAKEDHVSMGGMSARKALQVVENVETVIAIELLAAAQGLEFLRPLRSTPALEALHKLVRDHVPKWDQDRYMAPDIEAVSKLVRENRIWDVVHPWVEKAAMAEREKKL